MGRLALSLLLITVLTSLYATDYYPLQLNNSWTYHDYLGPDVNDTVSLTVIGDTLYQGNYAYILFSPPSIINDTLHIITFEKDGIIWACCSEISPDYLYFAGKHTFIHGDTFTIQNGEQAIATYTGNYTTQFGMVFDSCYTVFYRSSDEPNKYLLIFAPDVGLVEYKSFYPTGDTIVDRTIIDYTIQQTDIDFAISSGVINNKYYEIQNNKTFFIVHVPYKKYSWITLFTASGRKVLEIPSAFHETIRINKNHLSCGTYWLTIADDCQRKVYQFSVVK